MCVNNYEMRVEYDKIKKYLEIFVASEKPHVNTCELLDKLNYDSNSNSDLLELTFYMNLLNDQGIIECLHPHVENLGLTSTNTGKVILRVTNFRMTFLGHQTYEAMNQNKIWTSINSALLKLGDAGLKQIPALATKLILEQTNS